MDKIEDELGRPSGYQAWSILAALVLNIAVTATPQTGVFYNAVPNHRCALPIFSNQTLFPNITEEAAASFAIQAGESCLRRLYDPTLCLSGQNLSCLVNATDKSTVECDSGYIYDRTYFVETVVSEWDLVCYSQIWNTFVKSLYFAGAFCGSPPTGYLVDWFGRRPALLVLCLGVMVSGIGCSLAPTFAVYCAFRFLEGFFSLPCCSAVFSYVNELIGRKYRTQVGTLLLVTSCMSHTLLPVLAYFLRSWRQLNLCLALIALPFLIAYPFIPESPRWLLSKKKAAKANKIIVRYARSNSQGVDREKWIDALSAECERMDSTNDKEHISDLFRRPFTRVVSLAVIFNWFSICAVFYGLVLNVGALAGDPYVNAVLNGFTELIAITLYGIFVTKLGSRVCMTAGMLLSGVFCLVATVAKQFDQESEVALQIVRWSSIAGKLFVSIAFSSTYQYTADVHATVTRGKATALSSMFGRVGSIIVPFILLSRSETLWVTDAAFGILGISAAACCLLLPDTSSKVMLTTLEEAEEFYSQNMRFVAQLLKSDLSTARSEGKRVKETLLDANDNSFKA